MVQIDFVVFHFHYRILWIKVPLLSNDLSVRTGLAIGPAQRELLRSLSVWARKASHIRRMSFGSSNKSRIVCSPGWPARQPGVSAHLNADSIGYWGSSEETSTRAISSIPETSREEVSAKGLPRGKSSRETGEGSGGGRRVHANRLR